MPPSAAATRHTTTVPLSVVFCAEDADVVIRAVGALDFRAHKLILSLVSPIFRDMFTIPQPPTSTDSPPGTLPHVDVHESVKTWGNILRTVYPMPNPTIDNLDDLESLLLAARKYEMQFVTNFHKKSLSNPKFIQEDPLRLYAIACACGLDDQAKHAARNAEFLQVIKSSQGDYMKGLTVASYLRLITFLVERDNELHPILEQGWASFNSLCSCLGKKEGLYAVTREILKWPYSTKMEAIYLRALEDRSRYYGRACSAGKCTLVAREIKEFIERMLRERERVCDKFMWKQ